MINIYDPILLATEVISKNSNMSILLFYVKLSQLE